MITESEFNPAWWLKNRHWQTMWPSLFRTRETLPLDKERLELPDGDFLDLAWMPDHAGDLCLILHGLEGTLQSHYAPGLIKAASDAGKHVVFMHLRGCSGEPNRLPRRYHSGDTSDLRYMLELLKRKYPDKQIHVVGVSLGGNILLKYLGESGNESLVESAIAISVPFDLAIAAETLDRGTAKIYQRHLLNSLQSALMLKSQVVDLQIKIPEKKQIDTLYEFDDLITAPIHGFASADDYYTRSSSRQFIPAIRTPTLILHAIDDPFMTPSAIPGEKEIPSDVTLELSQAGGHVGFISGSLPFRPTYWLDHRVKAFLQSG
ncbi:MAG: hydrolase [Gammaproteobacteria bacterium]|nr:MAG: hydrolase [Gammaproteobacteria bacterium]